MDIYSRFPKAKRGYDWGVFFTGYAIGVIVAIGFFWVLL